MLRWYANRDDRRRVMCQLNKGESLHDLRTYLMIANKGHVRRNRSEDLANQASCLNLVTNAVILWNTVYMAEAVAQLRREGCPIHDSDTLWASECLRPFSLRHRGGTAAQGTTTVAGSGRQDSLTTKIVPLLSETPQRVFPEGVGLSQGDNCRLA